MIRTFKETPTFTEKWNSLGLKDDDLRMLENILLNDPKVGSAIKGTGGLRKLRFPIGDKGKRDGARVIYVDIEIKECIYFLNVYAKNEKIDLTEKENAEKISIRIEGGLRLKKISDEHFFQPASLCRSHKLV